jgi:hypothetical protein
MLHGSVRSVIVSFDDLASLLAGSATTPFGERYYCLSSGPLFKVVNESTKLARACQANTGFAAVGRGGTEYGR